MILQIEKCPASVQKITTSCYKVLYGGWCLKYFDFCLIAITDSHYVKLLELDSLNVCFLLCRYTEIANQTTYAPGCSAQTSDLSWLYTQFRMRIITQ